ncbi:hypothetical protein ACQPXM_06480 [Kribbella sp. CA-253562]|uniref:hypothetical protein n=1 Tax=Kribbella sp. CA-253562 TaxID=3239942 RepID=UPI003D8C4471
MGSVLTWFLVVVAAVVVWGCAEIYRERTIDRVARQALQAATPADRKYRLEVLQVITARSPRRQFILQLPPRRHDAGDPPKDPADNSREAPG